MLFLLSNQLLVVFFFQAEDGIRDLVRSRGLGDVYKRQKLSPDNEEFMPPSEKQSVYLDVNSFFEDTNNVTPVSYTHLTLPTSDLV